MMGGEENRLCRREVIRAASAFTITNLVSPVTAAEAASTMSEKLGGCTVYTPQAGIFALGRPLTRTWNLTFWTRRRKRSSQLQSPPSANHGRRLEE